MELNKLTSLQDAYDDLLDANRALEEAEKEESYARSNKTSALNRVNRAQKVFDEIVNKVKTTAPKDSDWNSTRKLVKL